MQRSANSFQISWGDDPIWRAYFSRGWFNHQLVRASRFFLWQCLSVDLILISFGAYLQDTRTLLRISDGRHYILAILAPDLKDKLKRRDLLNLSHMDELVKTYSMPFWTKWRGNLVVLRFFSTWTFSFCEFSTWIIPRSWTGLALVSFIVSCINVKYNTRWWFQIFFIFTSIWGGFPFWPIFFKWVESTNQNRIQLSDFPSHYCRMLVPNGGNLLPGPGWRQCHPALRVDQWHPWRPAITSCLGLPSRGRQWLFLNANLIRNQSADKLTSKGCLEESRMKWLWFSTLRYLFWISLVESSNLPGYMCWGVENNKPCVRRFDHQLL